MCSYDLLWSFALLDPLLDETDLVKGVGVCPWRIDMVVKFQRNATLLHTDENC
jgi:hypothetical protein